MGIHVKLDPIKKNIHGQQYEIKFSGAYTSCCVLLINPNKWRNNSFTFWIDGRDRSFINKIYHTITNLENEELLTYLVSLSNNADLLDMVNIDNAVYDSKVMCDWEIDRNIDTQIKLCVVYSKSSELPYTVVVIKYSLETNKRELKEYCHIARFDNFDEAKTLYDDIIRYRLSTNQLVREFL